MRSALLLFFCLYFATGFTQGEQRDEWLDVDRVVAIGDLHGDYDQYIRLLRLNNLVDRKLRWAGGQTHLVQLGDVPDRGPDSLKIIRHLKELAEDARRDGGYVHPLIGNHDAMNIEGDLRYVHPGEYEALVTRASKRNRRAYIARVREHLKTTQPERFEDPLLLAQLDERLSRQFPLGYVEHRRIWYPGNELADFVAGNNTVIKINRTLFVHGGIDPHSAYRPLGDINTQVRRILSDPQLATERSYVNSDSSPLWYRGLASNEAETELAPLVSLLDYYDADQIVIAHTPTKSGMVASRLEGRVIMADVGIAAHYGGHLANVEIRLRHEEDMEQEQCTVYNVTPAGKTCLK